MKVNNYLTHAYAWCRMELMELPRLTVAQKFEIKQPKWSGKERMALMPAHRVGTHNEIVFTEAPTMGTTPYYVSGRDVHMCEIKPVRTRAGGYVDMYYVPVRFLEPLERVDKISSKQLELI